MTGRAPSSEGAGKPASLKDVMIKEIVPKRSQW